VRHVWVQEKTARFFDLEFEAEVLVMGVFEFFLKLEKFLLGEKLFDRVSFGSTALAGHSDPISEGKLALDEL
jgi:hypothetical protein